MHLSVLGLFLVVIGLDARNSFFSLLADGATSSLDAFSDRSVGVRGTILGGFSLSVVTHFGNLVGDGVSGVLDVFHFVLSC